jgi:hypothetical protein
VPARQRLPSRQPLQQAPSRHFPPAQAVPSGFAPPVEHTGFHQAPQEVPGELLHSRLVQSWQRLPRSPQAAAALPPRHELPFQQPLQQLPAKHCPLAPQGVPPTLGLPQLFLASSQTPSLQALDDALQLRGGPVHTPLLQASGSVQ